jgi:hypothetical protein
VVERGRLEHGREEHDHGVVGWLAPASYPQAPLPLLILTAELVGIGGAVYLLDVFGSTAIALLGVLVGLIAHGDLARLQARRRPDLARYTMPMPPGSSDVGALLVSLVVVVAVLALAVVLDLGSAFTPLWIYVALTVAREVEQRSYWLLSASPGLSDKDLDVPRKGESWAAATLMSAATVLMVGVVGVVLLLIHALIR